MLNIRLAEKDDIEIILKLRLDLIRTLKSSAEYKLSKDFEDMTRDYFQSHDNVTVLAFDNDCPVGCATACLVDVMPTYDHPSGKRAHIMNVYVDEKYRRQNIGNKMIDMIIEYIKLWHITNISLDATSAGRGLYEKFGFTSSEEYMELNL